MPFKSDSQMTEEAMNDPQAGDRFTEMYSFWVHVLKRDGNHVTIMEARPPCELPRDGKVEMLTLREFKKRYAYGNIPGYSIRLVDRGNDFSCLLKGEDRV